jgi:hypothetical protein
MEEDDQPRILKRLAGMIGGLTAVLLAAAALKGAWQELRTDDAPAGAAPAQAADNAAAAEEAGDGGDNGAAPAKATPPAASLPTRYAKPKGVLEKRGDAWVATDTTQNLEAHFAEVRRTAEETILYDKDCDLYLNVPTRGGTVRWAHSDPMVWTDLYVVQPAGGRRIEARESRLPSGGRRLRAAAGADVKERD